MKKSAARLWHEEKAQGLAEYGLLLVLVSMAAIGSMKMLASKIGKTYTRTATCVEVIHRPGPGAGDHLQSQQTIQSSPREWSSHDRTLIDAGNDMKKNGKR